MELVFECNKEYMNTLYYTQTLHKDNSLCLVCLVDETEQGNQWDRYIIKCGHKFHSRCLRRWCGVKGCLNCPLCGDIPEVKESRYCMSCKNFGHSDVIDKCPRHTHDCRVKANIKRCFKDVEVY